MLSQDYSSLFSSGLRTLAKRVRRVSQSHFSPPTPTPLSGLVTPITPAPGISYIHFGHDEPQTPVLAPAPPPPVLSPAPVPGGLRKALRRMSTQTFKAEKEKSAKDKHATLPAPMPQIVRPDEMFAGFKSREDLNSKIMVEPALIKARVQKRVSFQNPITRDDASSDTSSIESAVTRAPPLAPRRKPVHLTIRTSGTAPRPLPATPPLSTSTAPPLPVKPVMTRHYSQPPHPVVRTQARKPVQRMSERPAQRTSQHLIKVQRPSLQQRAQTYQHQFAYAAPPTPNDFLSFSATSIEFPTIAPPSEVVSPYARPSRVPSHVKGQSHSSSMLPGFEKSTVPMHPYAAVSRPLPDEPLSATSGDWRAWHEERGGWFINA
ncbi:hypothetical protein PENSPDRAFT_679485 [Peniophora sp. CONT]|nr:hypothetical protein PENSPDRAFT_679485 [Peniophora sp. CONT]